MADCFTDEPTDSMSTSAPIFLGILGSRTDATHEKILEEVLMPILQELGRPPDKVLLPEEGTSTIYISDWADSLKIPSQLYQCDWQRHGKRARLFRDVRIQEESTHFIVFLNKRSEFNEKLGTRLARKGYRVFTVAYKDWSIEELVVSSLRDRQETEQPPQSHRKNPPSGQPSGRARHGRTQGTGKAQGLHQLQLSKDPGSQQLRIDPWVT